MVVSRDSHSRPTVGYSAAAFVLPPHPAYNDVDAAIARARRASKPVRPTGRCAIADPDDPRGIHPAGRRRGRCDALFGPASESRADADLFQYFLNPLCRPASLAHSGNPFGGWRFRPFRGACQSMDYGNHPNSVPAVSARGPRTADQDAPKSVADCGGCYGSGIDYGRFVRYADEPRVFLK